MNNYAMAKQKQLQEQKLPRTIPYNTPEAHTEDRFISTQAISPTVK